MTTSLSSSLDLITAIGPPDAPQVVSDVAALLAASIGERAAVEASGVELIVAVATGPRQDYRQRAWQFTFDGHPFYVITLGTLGTYVYDVSTQQWAQFSTQGYGVWNMEYGVEWDGGVVGGDNILPNIWRLDPSSFVDDDFRPVLRVATGGLQINGRDTLRTGTFVLSAANQTPGVSTATVELQISDDEGRTYRSMGILPITDVDREIAWRSLGLVRAPGRVFRIVDEGGIVRIDGADMNTGQS